MCARYESPETDTATGYISRGGSPSREGGDDLRCIESGKIYVYPRSIPEESHFAKCEARQKCPPGEQRGRRETSFRITSSGIPEEDFVRVVRSFIASRNEAGIHLRSIKECRAECLQSALCETLGFRVPSDSVGCYKVSEESSPIRSSRTNEMIFFDISSKSQHVQVYRVTSDGVSWIRFLVDIKLRDKNVPCNDDVHTRPIDRDKSRSLVKARTRAKVLPFYR